MDIRDLQTKLQEIYHKKFKNSSCSISYGCFKSTTLFVNVNLANNVDECINRIAQNDMFNIMFTISTVNGTDRDCREIDYSNEDLILECSYNNYHIVPKNQYLCYGSRKVPFRKTTGNLDKILKSFEKFVDKLYDSVKNDLDNGFIHNNYIDLVKTKI